MDEENDKKDTHIRIGWDIYFKLCDIAKSEDRSVNAQIERFLKQAIEAYYKQ